MSVLWFLSVRMKKQELSHIYGCQQQFMSVLWFLSVRMYMLDANVMRLFG
jgi:hypothetical protein